MSAAVSLHRFPSEDMTRRQIGLAILGLLVCLFLAAVDTSIVNTALPRITTELRGFDRYTWITTAYLLTSTAVVPVAGKLGDRYGRRRLLVGGVIFFLCITTLCGLAQDMPQLIALRALQGVGGGVLMASIFSLFGELFEPVARARMSGLITITFSAASVLGPLIGGFLTDALTWRAVFYANLPFGILALIGLWRAVPAARTRSTRRLPIDWAGAVTVTLGTVLLLLGLSWGGRDLPWTSPQVIGLFALSLAVLVLFVRIEARAVDPVVPLSLFRDNVIALTSLGSLVHQMAYFGAALFIPLYVQGVLGGSATMSGGVLAPLVAAIVVTNIACGLLVAQYGRYKVFLVAGFVTCVLAFACLELVSPQNGYTLLLVSMVVLGVGSGFLVGTLNLAAQNAAAIEQMGVVTAFSQFSRALGGTLGSAVLGSILLMSLGPNAQNVGTGDLLAIREPLHAAIQHVFLASAGFMLAGLVASALMVEIPMRRRRTADGRASNPSTRPAEPFGPAAPAGSVSRQP